MSLTIVIARDVQKRFHGFLRSVMIEVDVGVYVSTRLDKAARGRLWSIFEDWFKTLARGSIVMIWRDRSASDHIGLKTLGMPRRDIVDIDNFLLTRRDLKK